MIIFKFRRWKLFCLVIFLILFSFSCLLHLVVFSNTIYCLHWIKQVINKLCDDYEEGLVSGELCNDICKPSNEQFIIKSCGAQHLGKAVVFMAELEHNTVIMKSSHNEIHLFEPFPLSVNESNQSLIKSIIDFSRIISDMIDVDVGSDRVGFRNLSSSDFLKSILMTDFGFKIDDFQASAIVSRKNWSTAFKSLWSLFQQREYLIFKYLENSKLFPRVIGSCGHVYAVEYYRPVSEFIDFGWEVRTKIALGIVSWLERAEYSYEEPLRICDNKFIHFGIAENFQVKFLDADDVYFQSTLNSVVTFNNACTSHQDCSYFHCFMECDLRNNVCDTTSINNNLQVTYSKLFSSSIPKSIFIPNLLRSLPMANIEKENLRQLFSDPKSTRRNFDKIKLFLKSVLPIK